ncbi:hypothetical protein ADL35_09485, partial [Streptomyces sp. NRRL WC-3753]
MQHVGVGHRGHPRQTRALPHAPYAGQQRRRARQRQGQVGSGRVPAAVPLDGSAAENRDAVREIDTDRHRFVTGPKLSPDGQRAVWIAWDHPRMPWDGTELKIAEVTAEG